ncbi:hypothetical protein X801_05424 [Opisthorchis viverrini]|uniref:Uncharacterized protein n=1 Tax=Opisthorchis viverrini TaxID=6198 RepID=A0A1S8WW48_OPIVI|nr:hypothetical protein X801_05424 [Opisthorchis viverrini]
MDSRHRHQEYRKQKQQQPVIPWDSRMVAEVDVVCRSKVPHIPECDIDAYAPSSLSEYEYDFILERQILADYEQYWDQKRCVECSPPVSLSNPTDHPSSPRIGSSTPTAAICPQPVAVTTTSTEPDKSDPQSKVAVPSDSSAKIDKAEPVPEPLPNMPVAARHLLSGRVLQPDRTVTNSTSMTPGEPSLLNVSKHVPESTVYLRDFDTGPDDPFANAELKTINDLEELRNVLLSSPVNTRDTQSTLKQHTGQLTPPSTVIVQDGFSTSPPINHPSPSNEQSIQYPRAPPPFRPLALNFTTSGFSPAFHPKFTPHQSLQVGSMSGTNAANALNGLGVLPGRSLSSSVPNFEAAGLTERPNSVAGVVLSTNPHPSIPNKSIHAFEPRLPTGGSQQRSGFPQPVARTPAELDALVGMLIDWTKQAGWPESRARSLLQIPQNRARFSHLTLDKAKQQLAEQLHLVQLLLNEYAPVGGSSNRLSEQTAVVAVSAFPHDFLKARQFAKVALDLEQCGHPQEVTQSFLLDARLNHEATLAQFLSALPRPAVSPRPVHAPGPSWQGAPITRPQTKR